MGHTTRCWPNRWQGLLVLLIAAGFLPALAAVASGERPNAPRPQEQIGPIAPSIHVPPVRTAPPALTKLIERLPQYDRQVAAKKRQMAYRMESLRLAIEDLTETFGSEYPNREKYLDQWHILADALANNEKDLERRFAELRNATMLANPLLDFDQLLVLKRKRGQLGLPTNHQCNTTLNQRGYDNELCILSSVRKQSQLTTVYRPREGLFLGEMDLHFDADRLLFTMPNGRTWQIHEIGLDGKALRQVSREVTDVDNFDSCYLPDGRIVFSSTASYTGVPCWHGRERACCLYLMNPDGSGVRQLCYDQDLDLHPSVLSNGQVIFSRWDYTGILHAYVRPLMVMNPDGTNQRAVYGTNCYYPNCLFYPRGIPKQPNRLVAILSGYHGQNRSGELAVLDLTAGWQGQQGILHRITHRGEPIVPVAMDNLTKNASPKFLHPYPLSDKYIITAMQPGPQKPWGIYLVDVFDNVTPLLVDSRFDFYEPIPVKKRPHPPAIPDRVDYERDDAVVVLHDVYRGPGLKDVPRGTVQRLRIVAYNFGYPGMAGPDKIGRAGPWEVMRILGTVPVYEDGSARFRVPANTPLSLQALDAEGKAVQLMRSWYTAMPGETTSCVGCHETPREAPSVRGDVAASSPVSEIEPWYGPPRGFDFAREVQPVLDEHCATCHNGAPLSHGQTIPDLRAEYLVSDYEGLPLTRLGATRIDPSIVAQNPERFSSCRGMPLPYGELRTHYTPAYEALIPYIRRVNVEDGAELLRPGEYHADTSELIQLLKKGHYGVNLDAEAWDRLVTWIDLNGPCHGTWSDVADVPGNADQKRHELAQSHGGPKTDPEIVPVSVTKPAGPSSRAIGRAPSSRKRREVVAGLLKELQLSDPDHAPLATMSLKLGDDLAIKLVRVPAGRFIMGDVDAQGADDEWPASIVTISNDFWISSYEITNTQFRQFLPEHSSGFFTKRQIDRDGPGIQLNLPEQPAVRVSWEAAMEFCKRLSAAVKRPVTLPTEAQWEYAARAGTSTPLSYGDVAVDFSKTANMADRSIACLYKGTAGVANLQPIPALMQYDDQAIGTAAVGSYAPNAWGVYDIHGNAVEWTRSEFRDYPYDADDGRNAVDVDCAIAKRVVRGGSFYDRPLRCRSSFRLAYPAWQSVPNTGFRIVVEDQ